MKRFYLFCILMILVPGAVSFELQAQQLTATLDTVKATTYMATFVPRNGPKKKYLVTGIYAAPLVWVELYTSKKQVGIRFNYPDKGEILALGAGVKSSKGVAAFPMAINGNAAYKLMISLAADSAANFTIFSAYAFLPELDKWKLIGSVKTAGYLAAMERPAPFYSLPKKDTTRPEITDEWVQRANGSWVRMDGKKMAPPVVNLLSHADSLAGVSTDKALIEKAIAEKSLGSLLYEKGIYYQIEREGTGKQVILTDTVKVYYKGYLLGNGSVFDQTPIEQARRFPLSRLIVGWQIGLPLIKEGGKIKIVIPSHLGYSIRTRSPKIPPNSILVFEVEVLEAKASPL